MKLNSKLTLIAVVSILLCIPIFMKVSASVRRNELMDKYSRAITKSCEDAVTFALVPNTSDSIEIAGEGSQVNYQTSEINLDASLQRFYDTFALNFNTDSDSLSFESLKMKIPVKVLIGYDGFYVNYWEESEDNTKIENIWTDKIEYLYHDTDLNIQIYYTLDDMVKIVEDNSGKEVIGKYDEISKKYNSIFFEDYKKNKQNYLADNINKTIQRYNMLTNEIASKHGWNYNFKLFTVPERALDDITFLAFVQFEPVSMGKDVNMYAFGGSKLLKKDYVYGDSKTKIYHKKSCKTVSNFDKIFDDEKSAAKNGYSPDLECITRDN